MKCKCNAITKLNAKCKNWTRMNHILCRRHSKQQHMFSLVQASRLAVTTDTLLSDVVHANFRLVRLVRRSADKYNTAEDEVNDALVCDDQDIRTLGKLLVQLKTSLRNDDEKLSNSVFLVLGMLIFFASFKFEQTGVDVSVGDVYDTLDYAETPNVSRRRFIVLFFKYGTANVGIVRNSGGDETQTLLPAMAFTSFTPNPVCEPIQTQTPTLVPAIVSPAIVA